MKIFTVCLLASMLCTTIDCGPGQQPQSSAGAYHIRLGQGATWATDTIQFDPGLPGYRLRGGIGRLELSRESETYGSPLVMEISTSPGLQPNLDSFTFIWGDTLLTVAPCSGGQLSDLMAKIPEGRWKTLTQRATKEYFEFHRSDSTVRVLLLPEAPRLVRTQCTISWVDWYRR